MVESGFEPRPSSSRDHILNLVTILQNFMYIRMPIILKHVKNISVSKALIKYTKVKAIYSQEPGYFYVTLLLQLCTYLYRLFLKTRDCCEKSLHNLGKFLQKLYTKRWVMKTIRIASLQDGPSDACLLVAKPWCGPSTFNKRWLVWPIEYCMTSKGKVKKGTAASTFVSWISSSGKSQLPCHGDTQVVWWRASLRDELMPPDNSSINLPPCE